MQSNASKNADSTEKKLTSGKDQRGSQLEEEFSRQFLHGMSYRIKSDFGPKQLERFLNNKFEFFLEAMGKQGLLRLERGKEPGEEEEAKPYFHAIPPPCLRMSSIPPRSIKLMDSSIH